LSLAVISATQHLITGDQWKEVQALIEIRVFERIYVSLPTVVADVKGLYPCCDDQLQSLEYALVILLKAIQLCYSI